MSTYLNVIVQLCAGRNEEKDPKCRLLEDWSETQKRQLYCWLENKRQYKTNPRGDTQHRISAVYDATGSTENTGLKYTGHNEGNERQEVNTGGRHQG